MSFEGAPRMVLAEKGNEAEGEQEQFNNRVAEGVARALDIVEERFVNAPDKENNLVFHNRNHSEGVVRRTELILETIRKADPSLVNERDIGIGKLAAAYHDTVQNWEAVPKADGNFEKIMRVRAAGNNETASSGEAVRFIKEVNGDGEDLFSAEDEAVVRRAIDATVPGWDPENKTVKQPNLVENSSLVERALALADLGTAGMDGAQAYLPEGKALFLEENLDIARTIEAEGLENIAADKKEYFKGRMVGWLTIQPGFARGRQARLEMELAAIPTGAREAVAALFDKFDESINAASDVLEKAKGMSFEQLAIYMGY